MTDKDFNAAQEGRIEIFSGLIFVILALMFEPYQQPVGEVSNIHLYKLLLIYRATIISLYYNFTGRKGVKGNQGFPKKSRKKVVVRF
jgi:hypothetical protein